MQWPPSESILTAALEGHEDSDFELKQQWHDLSSKHGKAEFVKDVIALANATSPERAGHIVFGVEDARHGGRVLGVGTTPDSEQLQQILSSYSSPVPDLKCAHIQYSGVTVSVLRVGWTPSHPYYVTRDHAGVLDSRLVYTRRGGTVGFLRPHEVEDLLRQKEMRIRLPRREQTLEAGFVESGRWRGGKAVARIVNLTDEPVADLSVSWDVRLPAFPALFSRVRSSNGGRLEAGETHEVELDPADQYFASLDEGLDVRQGLTPGTRWFDVTLRVEFRDRSGFLRQLERHLSLGG